MILTKNSIPIAFLSLAIALMSFEVRKIPDEPPSLLLNSACKPGTKGEIKDTSPQKTTQREAIAKEMEEVLTSSMMDLWYSRCLDKEYGGYLSGFDKEWNQKEKQPKFIVTQARHSWASAQMALMYPHNSLYREASEHGYKFLRDVMWDKDYGGYYTLTDREGIVSTTEGNEPTKIA